jgi:2-desacetyl-2-hydroxyethyl bacteriochlorophyllide A dehydrogenase
VRAVYLEAGIVSVREMPVPEPQPGYALIRLRVAGICNTDLELKRGYYGFAGTPGHEFVGDVLEGPAHLEGRRVVGEINLACGHCALCAKGWGRHCASRKVLGIFNHPGAFAEMLTLPVENVRVVPEHLSDEEAVFTEPVAAACQILDQVRIARGEPVAVLGAGKLGLLIAQVLQAHGAHVVLYGRHSAALELANGWGIAVARAGDPRPRAEYAVVVDATGASEGLNEAIAMTQPRGTVVMKSTVTGQVPVNTAAAIVHEITLLGSRCGRFEPALELLASGGVRVAAMIDSSFRLEDAAVAFERAETKGVLKVLLR